MFRIRDNVYCDVCGDFGEKWANYDFSALDEKEEHQSTYNAFNEILEQFVRILQKKEAL